MPPSGISAIQTLVAGDLMGGARGLLPVMIGGLTPVLVDLLTSSGVDVSLTDEEITELSAGASAAALGLIDGNFSAVLHAFARVGGVPSSAVVAVEAVVAGDLMGGARGLVPIAAVAVVRNIYFCGF